MFCIEHVSAVHLVSHVSDILDSEIKRIYFCGTKFNIKSSLYTTNTIRPVITVLLKPYGFPILMSRWRSKFCPVSDIRGFLMLLIIVIFFCSYSGFNQYSELLCKKNPYTNVVLITVARLPYRCF